MTQITYLNTTADGKALAVLKRPATNAQHQCGILFLHGFCSDMRGSKATEIDAYAERTGYAFTRFDYRGHGESQGNFADYGITDWLNDAAAVLETCTQPQIVVGSSLGGWLALLLALRHPNKVLGMVGIAAAPDFTQDLMYDLWDDAQQQQFNRDGFLPYALYDGAPAVPLTKKLIDSGAAHLLLRDEIDYKGSVRLLQGMGDMDVPWQTTLRIAECLTSDDVQLHFVKYADHRMASHSDLALLIQVLDGLCQQTESLLQVACDV